MSTDDALIGVRTPEQEHSMELHIVKDVMNGISTRFPPNEDSFLWHLFMAFQKADRANFELLRSAIQVIIERDRLECGCKRSSSA